MDKQVSQLKAIIRATLKYCTVVEHPLSKFWPDRKTEKNAYVVKMFIVGFADMYSIDKSHTVNMLCIEDIELYGLRDRFKKFLCQTPDYNMSAWKNGDYARYIVQYRKIANEIELNGIQPYPYNGFRLFSPTAITF